MQTLKQIKTTNGNQQINILAQVVAQASRETKLSKLSLLSQAN
jgi:hypothetical protein